MSTPERHVLTTIDTSKIVFDDLEPIKIEVSVKGKDYILSEASGDAGTKWNNARTKCFRATQSGITSAEGLADTEPLLVSLCMKDSSGRQVSIQEIKSWPYRYQKMLFEKAKEISNLAEDEQTEEQLETKIAQLQEKLDKKRSKGPNPTMNGSSTAET